MPLSRFRARPERGSLGGSAGVAMRGSRQGRGQRPPWPGVPGTAGRALPRGPLSPGGHRSCSRHAPLGEDFKPSATTSSVSRPSRPATGGGSRVIGRPASARFDWPSRLPARSCARGRLHFVGRGRGRKLSDAEVVSSWLQCSWALFAPCLVSPWKGRGLRCRAGAGAAATAPSLKSVSSGGAAGAAMVAAALPIVGGRRRGPGRWGAGGGRTGPGPAPARGRRPMGRSERPGMTRAGDSVCSGL